MHGNCQKLSLDTLHLRGKPLAAFLILHHLSDVHGISQLTHQQLAEYLDIRHPKNVRNIIRRLKEAGMVVTLPGNGRGHATTFILINNRSDGEMFSLLTERLGLSSDQALSLLSTRQTASNREDILAGFDQQRHIEKDAVEKGPYPKGPLPPLPSEVKGAVKKGPFPEGPLQKGPLATDHRPGKAKGPAHKGGLSEGPLQQGPLSTAPQPISKKGPAQKGPLPERPLPQSPFEANGPAGAPPFSTTERVQTSSDRARVRTHARTRAVAGDKRSSHLDKKQQQQQGRRNVHEHPYEVERQKDLEEAFRVAGIKKPTALRIPKAWKQATGRALTPEDVLAWHFQRQAENRGRAPERHMGVGAVIRYLEAGEPADKRFYEDARDYLVEQEADRINQEETFERVPQAILALQQALAPFLPSQPHVGSAEEEVMHRRLLDLAHELHAQGVHANELNDLRLYLAYTNQPFPPPDEVEATLARIGPEFSAWRKRRVQAEQLWRHIIQQLHLSDSTLIGQAMRRAYPVDLNGALVVMAEADVAIYFDRIWQRQGPLILAAANHPKDFPIRFLELKKATEVRRLQ